MQIMISQVIVLYLSYLIIPTISWPILRITRINEYPHDDCTNLDNSTHPTWAHKPHPRSCINVDPTTNSVFLTPGRGWWGAEVWMFASRDCNQNDSIGWMWGLSGNGQCVNVNTDSEYWLHDSLPLHPTQARIESFEFQL